MKILKEILLICAIAMIMVTAKANANEVTIDPTQANETTLTLTCVYPIEREDGTALNINEIAKVNFFVTADGTRTFVGSNDAQCKQVIDMTNVPDNVYVYVVQTEDTDGRMSVDSTNVTATVKRIANPNQPAEMLGTVS